MYCYPEEITEELIDVMADCDKICKYIDIPIQHSEDKILKRMGRRTNRKELVDLITALRSRIPDIAIRTTLITGFPGETEEEHESVCEFINDMEFDRLGVFTYSPEEGTPAAAFEDQVPEDIAEGWRDEIMELQQEISYDRNQSFVGKRLKVLIEGYLDDGDVYIGRSYRDAPSVDGMIFVHADHELISGAFVDVDITEANEYDLIGDVAE